MAEDFTGTSPPLALAVLEPDRAALVQARMRLVGRGRSHGSHGAVPIEERRPDVEPEEKRRWVGISVLPVVREVLSIRAEVAVVMPRRIGTFVVGARAAGGNDSKPR